MPNLTPEQIADLLAKKTIESGSFNNLNPYQQTIKDGVIKAFA